MENINTPPQPPQKTIEEVEKTCADLRNKMIEAGYQVLAIYEYNANAPSDRQKEVPESLIDEQKNYTKQHDFFSKLLKEMKKAAKEKGGQENPLDFFKSSLTDIKSGLASIQQSMKI